MHNDIFIEGDKRLVITTQMIQKFGDTAAKFLAQLNYWLKKDAIGFEKSGKKWIYNTATEWSAQIGVSTRSVERAIKKLKDIGVIEVSKLSPVPQIQTNYFTIDYESYHLFLRGDDNDKHLKKSVNKNDNREGKASEAVEKSHSDTVSGSPRRSVGIYTKITNKDYLNNKSEKNFEKNNFVTNTVGQGTTSPTTPEEKRTSLEEYQAQETINPTENSKTSPEVPAKAPLETNENVQKTTPQPTIVQDMMREITSELPTLEAKLTKDIAKCLVAAFKTKFDNDLNRFAHYLKRIKSSKYLMGEGFILTLNWILSYKTIDRILNGELGVTLAEYNVPKDLETIATTHIDTQSESDIAKKIRQRYKSYFGADMYTAWMMQVIIHTQDTRVVIEAPSRFVKDRVQQHVDQLIWAMR
jgi:hypothetical protein